ncbi:hypothetical protein CDAR_488761 [Caerostris darwini]|uniref:Uncharacterized protein n=1 Tax=Caerostris darwini TaxID=1538125 RepID=A0AAV4NKQ0_9ARAC|nr:hypothetical protein CDAR_488761 [Caerostris darwini]
MDDPFRFLQPITKKFHSRYPPVVRRRNNSAVTPPHSSTCFRSTKFSVRVGCTRLIEHSVVTFMCFDTVHNTIIQKWIIFEDTFLCSRFKN